MNPKTKTADGVAVDSTRTSTTTGLGKDTPLAPSEAGPSYATSPAAPRPSYGDACTYHVSAGYDTHRLTWYMLARIAVISLGVVLFPLALVADFKYKKRTWVNPIMTPSLTALGYSAYDLYLVLAHCRRGHPHIRIFYDGICLGSGLAVASGFLTAWTVQSAPEIGYGISVPILVGMYGMVAVQYSLGVNGVYQVVQMRSKTRQEGV
ncbi:hypothetical protein SEUCBS139899_007992 [Sporothrix eucalyptigena]